METEQIQEQAQLPKEFDLTQLMHDTWDFFYALYHIILPFLTPITEASRFYGELLEFFDGNQFGALVPYVILLGMYAFVFGCFVALVWAVITDFIYPVIILPIILISLLCLMVFVAIVSIFLPDQKGSHTSGIEKIQDWCEFFCGQKPDQTKRKRKQSEIKAKQDQQKRKQAETMAVWYISNNNISK